MKSLFRGTVGLALCGALAGGAAAVSAFAEEAAAVEMAEGEEKPASKKRPSRKENEYRNWEKASAAAEAWEQPILAFIDLPGVKRGNVIKLEVLGRNEVMKELVGPNGIYFHVTVPKVKEKQQQNGNNNKNRVKPVPKPDWNAMKGNEKDIAKRICGNQVPPVVAVVGANGQVLSVVPIETEGAVLGEFVSSVKSAFELGNHEFAISPKLQKMIDKEAKKVADLEKRKR